MAVEPLPANNRAPHSDNRSADQRAVHERVETNTRSAASDVLDTRSTVHRSVIAEFTRPGETIEGTVVFRPNGPGFIMRDGALAMKFVGRVSDPRLPGDHRGALAVRR